MIYLSYFIILPFLAPLTATANDGPAWWTERGAINPASAPADYAAITVGQLKNIATAGAAEVEAHLPGGAGADLTALIDSWSTLTSGTLRVVTGSNAVDYAPANLGQVKAVAAFYYNRFLAEHYVTSSYVPWLTATNANASDYAMANIGQTKHLFSFDFVLAADNTLPVQWRLDNFGCLWVAPFATDAAVGLTYLTDYLEGRSPNKGAVADSTGAVNLRIFTPLH